MELPYDDGMLPPLDDSPLLRLPPSRVLVPAEVKEPPLSTLEPDIYKGFVVCAMGSLVCCSTGISLEFVGKTILCASFGFWLGETG